MPADLATLRATAEAARDAAVIVNDTEGDAQAWEDADIAWLKLRDACSPPTILALLARLERAEAALFGCMNLLALEKFEPDEGAPPMIKDGVWDRVMDAARAYFAATEEDRTP